jgi:hypothetical protein
MERHRRLAPVADLCVMLRRRNIAVAGLVGVFLVLLGLSWVCGRGEPGSRRLKFKPGDRSITPLFVIITRGRLETNNNRAGYVHPPFYQPCDRVEPISALNSRVRNWVRDGLYRLGFRGAVDRLGAGAIEMAPNTFPSMLWFGYKSTDHVFARDAVLVSEKGLRLPLRWAIGQSITNDSEHLDCWELPSLLTNRGKYRLTRPESKQTLVTFDYE